MSFRLAPSPHPTGAPPGVTYVEVRPGVFAHPDDADRYRASLASAGIPHIMAPATAPDKPDIKITREPPPDHKPAPVPFKPPPLPRPADIRPDIKLPDVKRPPALEAPAAPPPAPTPGLAQLDRFRKDDGYDLVEIMQAAVNKPELRDIALKNFDMTAVRQAEILAKPGVPVEDWEKLSPERQKMLRPVRDVTADEFEKMTDWERLYVRNIVAEPAKKPGVVDIVRELALSAIPVYGTIRHWDDAGTAGRALGIAADALWLVPFVGGISAGVRMATTPSQAKAIMGSVKNIAIAEIKAPYTAVRHPLRTAKAALEPVETLVRPGKLPLAGMEMRYSTQRIPIIGDEVASMALRDQVTRQLIHGQKGAAKIGDLAVEVSKPMALKGIGPAAIHTSPDIRPFLQGATVQAGREGGLFVAPTVHTRFAAASAFGDMPAGGVRGIVLIRDQKILDEIVSSAKIFRRKLEVEGKVPPAIKLPKPRQVLMTRDIAGEPLSIAVIGKPLTKAEIARFKLVGAGDTLRTIFKPSVAVRRQSKQAAKLVDEARDLGTQIQRLQRDERALRRAGKVAEARAAGAAATRLVTRLDTLQRRIEGMSRGRVEFGAYSTRKEPVLTRTRATPPPDDAVRVPRIPGEPAPPPVTPRKPAPPPDRPVTPVTPRVTPEDELIVPPPDPRIRRDPDDPVPPPPPPPRLRVPPTEPEITVPPPPPPRRVTDDAPVIKRVEGVPDNPGIIEWDQGIVRIRMVPPYRPGTEDITYIPRKPPARGEGSPERSLTVRDGDPPARVVVGMGLTEVDILKGKKMDWGPRGASRARERKRAPRVMRSDGRMDSIIRGTVI